MEWRYKHSVDGDWKVISFVIGVVIASFFLECRQRVNSWQGHGFVESGVEGTEINK
jgi:hypothetical protein